MVGQAIAGLNSSFRVFSTQYLLLLSLLLYVMFVVFITDDLALFMSSGLELPVVRIEVPVVLFYALMPLVITTMFINTVLHLYIIRKKSHVLQASVNKKKSWRVENLAQVALSPGPYLYPFTNDIIAGFPKFILNTLFHVSIFLLPILTLLALQWRFLAYHSEFITLLNQLAVIVATLSSTAFLFQELKRFNLKLAWALSSGIFFLILGISIFILNVPTSDRPQNQFPWSALPDFLVYEDKSRSELRPAVNAFFSSRNLDLSNMQISGTERNETFRQNDTSCGEVFNGVSANRKRLTNRDLRYANFSNTLLENFDFEGSNTDLSKSVFVDAIVSNVKFSKKSDLSEIKAASSCIVGSLLDGADIFDGDFQGASFINSSMDYANFEGANLDGSKIIGKAYGANRSTAVSTNFSRTEFQGAVVAYVDFNQSNFAGADLSGSQFISVSLDGSDLRATDFSNGYLISSSASNIRANGVSLENTHVIGTNFRSSDLSFSFINGSVFIGSNFTTANLRFTDGKADHFFRNTFKATKSDHLSISTINRSQDPSHNAEKVIDFVSSISILKKYNLLEVANHQISLIKQLEGDSKLSDNSALSCGSPSIVCVPIQKGELEVSMLQATELSDILCEVPETACQIMEAALGTRRQDTIQRPLLFKEIVNRRNTNQCPTLLETEEIWSLDCKGTPFTEVAAQFR